MLAAYLQGLILHRLSLIQAQFCKDASHFQFRAPLAHKDTIKRISVRYGQDALHKITLQQMHYKNQKCIVLHDSSELLCDILLIRSYLPIQCPVFWKLSLKESVIVTEQKPIPLVTNTKFSFNDQTKVKCHEEYLTLTIILLLLNSPS